MAENGHIHADQLSPANPEAEIASPESGGLPQIVAAGEDTIVRSEIPVVAENGNGVVDSGAGAQLGVQGSTDGTVKKKRGRPRKYEVDVSTAVQVFGDDSGAPSEPSSKRGRGRPKGSGKMQLLVSAGDVFSRTAGRSFIPYVETVNTGEDVVARITSYSQKGPRAVCVLSATGIVSNVILHQPTTTGGALSYEGRFEILSLSGSYTFSEASGPRRKSGKLSVSLAQPDGRVFGGAVAGHLIAAGPIQLVVGTFKQSSKKDLQRQPAELSMAAGAHLDTVRSPSQAVRATDGEEICATPTSVLSEPNNGGAHIGDQHVNLTPFDSVCWNDSTCATHVRSKDIA